MTIKVRLSKKMYSDLDIYAKRRRISRSEYIRQLIHMSYLGRPSFSTYTLLSKKYANEHLSEVVSVRISDELQGEIDILLEEYEVDLGLLIRKLLVCYAS